jgi:predicted nucleic acid-binding protein
MNVLIDTHSCVEFLLGTPQGALARKYIEDPDDEHSTNEVAISAVTVAELMKWALKNGDERAERAVSTFISQVSIIPLDEGIAREAGRIAAAHTCGLGDALIYATAQALDAKLLTGDPHFKGARDTIYIGK